MITIVSGSSGTGKTSIARLLARKLEHKYLDVNKIIEKNKLRGQYIRKFDTYEVDIKELNKILIGIINKNKNLIIDSHLSHYLPKKYVDYCVICKCNLKALKKRLKKRGYSENKTRENLDSEIFDVCLAEAVKRKHKVIAVDTSKKKISRCVKEILNLFSKSSLLV